MACILLIHHDPIQLYFFKTLLNQDHDEVVSCGCIEDSLRVLEVRDDIDGIVLDLHMPNADWWPFYQRVQTQIYRSHRLVPILAVSSHYAQTEAQKICAEFQVDTYLAFPVDPQRFRQCVRDLVPENLGPNPLCVKFEVEYDEACSMLSLTSADE